MRRRKNRTKKIDQDRWEMEVERDAKEEGSGGETKEESEGETRFMDSESEGEV
jgi:hypothetical protein